MATTEGIASGAVETPADIGLSPSDQVRRWLVEIKLSSKGEDRWRQAALKVYLRYRAKERKKNSFNILWSNTEILRPAIYNSPPKPDVRRRYRDDDPIGKAVSETLGRALEFSCQSYDIDTPLKLNVLDMLLVGRGISRIRYVPSFKPMGAPGETDTDAPPDSPDAEQAGAPEALEWEQVVCEHVNWQDWRRGPGRVWSEVTWIAFRHRVTRRELIEQFGEEIGNAVKLEDASDDDLKNMREHDPVKQLFATGEIWEIWDKDSKTVAFYSAGYPKGPLSLKPDPLGLQDFFPVVKPLMAVEDSETLEPILLFSQYEEQADELNAVSRRINKITDALKLRGVYDATITELKQVERADDNTLVPAKNVSAFLDRGGIDKMVWWWPVEQAANVLAQLMTQREQCVATIWQLTGIADIMRGDTDAAETATAQGIKTAWGTIRLQRLQKEVQRYARDLIRLMGEVIAKKFQIETLAAMTELKFATPQQMVQLQQQAMAAQQQGQPSPPPPIAWEQVAGMLRSNATRSFHVDIETDSTVASQLQGDMRGLQEVLTAVVNFIQGVGPAVQEGAMPIEAVKEIVLTICRRARLGSAVEDSLDKMQQPQGGGKGAQAEQAKLQATMQIEQAKMQAQQQMHAADLQQKMALAQQESQLEQQEQARRAQVDIAVAQAQQQAQAQQRQLELQSEQAMAQQKAQNDRATAVEVAQIHALAQVITAQISAASVVTPEQTDAAEQAVEPQEQPQQPDMTGALIQQMGAQHSESLGALHQLLSQLVAQQARPRKIVRDGENRVVGVE